MHTYCNYITQLTQYHENMYKYRIESYRIDVEDAGFCRLCILTFVK